jgi:hypothetical protein
VKTPTRAAETFWRFTNKIVYVFFLLVKTPTRAAETFWRFTNKIVYVFLLLVKTPTRAEETFWRFTYKIAYVFLLLVKTPTRAVGYLLAIHLQDCLCISLVGENTNKGCGIPFGDSPTRLLMYFSCW